MTDKQVTLRMTSEEFEIIQAAAKKDRRNFSNFILAAALKSAGASQ